MSGDESSEEDDSFTYMTGMLRRRTELDDTELTCSLYDDSLDRETDFPVPSAWHPLEQRTLKYVDDFISVEKVSLAKGYALLSQKKQELDIHATGCERFFHTVTKNAAEIGMRVNERKTQLLCLNTARHSNVSAYVRMADGSKIMSQSELKQLGFYFSSKATLDSHLQHMRTKVRGRYWIIRHLKKAKVPEKDLILLYKCFILPLIDYASVVYHSMLTLEQAKMIENLQSFALKLIFGTKKKYSEILEENEPTITCVFDRRQKLVDQFILKTLDNENYSEEWFPKKSFSDQNLRTHLYYREDFARTDRLFNSPIFYYRRRLNEIRIPKE